MSRVTAVVPDLLFASKVKAALEGAGHEVRLVSRAEDAREGLDDADVLVVDLTAPEAGGADLVRERALRSAGPRTLGFYSHVDVDTRRAGQAAGFDVVVPKSRMAREGADLVARLSATPA